MKLRVFYVIVLLMLFPSVFAEEISTTATQTETTYQNISYEHCTRMFALNKSDLFVLVIGAVNSNRFKLEEVQTDNGYLIFSSGKNKYLATVAEIDKDNSILKITPCNNLYYFQPVIISNIYKYIDQNKDI